MLGKPFTRGYESSNLDEIMSLAHFNALKSYFGNINFIAFQC